MGKKKKIPPYLFVLNGKADGQRKVRVLEEEFLQKTQRAKHRGKIYRLWDAALIPSAAQALFSRIFVVPPAVPVCTQPCSSDHK